MLVEKFPLSKLMKTLREEHNSRDAFRNLCGSLESIAFRATQRESTTPAENNLRQLRLIKILDRGFELTSPETRFNMQPEYSISRNNIVGTLTPSERPRLSGEFKVNVALITASYGLQFAGFEAAATYIVPALQAQNQSWLGLVSPVVLYAALVVTGGWAPRLIRKFGPKPLAILGATTYAAYTASLGLFSNSPATVLAASVLIGAGASLFHQGAAKIINSSVPDQDTVGAHGRKMSALFGGAAAGTCLFAALLDTVSMSSLFMGCAALNASAAAMLFFTKRIPERPEDQHAAQANSASYGWLSSFSNRKWLAIVAPLSFFGFGTLALGTGALKLDAVTAFGLAGVAITGPVFRIVMGIGGLFPQRVENFVGQNPITKLAAATFLGLGLIAAAPHTSFGLGLLCTGTVLLGVFPAICYPLFQGVINKNAANDADRDLGTATFQNWGNLGMCTAFLLPIVLPPAACYGVFGAIFLLGTHLFKRYHRQNVR